MLVPGSLCTQLLALYALYVTPRRSAAPLAEYANGGRLVWRAQGRLLVELAVRFASRHLCIFAIGEHRGTSACILVLI